MSEAPTAPAPPQSNSPFVQPVPPARTEADAAAARANVEVVRSDLAEAARVAHQTPAERFDTMRGTPGQRIGDRKLTDAEYNSLTYAERQAYAERRTALANGEKERTTPADPAKPAETQAKIKLADDFEITADEARGLMERAALEESRKLTTPYDPKGYKLGLPADFVQPPGIEFKFDEADPAVQLAREFAHKNGFSQEQFTGMIAVHAAGELQKLAELKAARDAEAGKLGATGTLRITAIDKFLRAHLGDEIAKPFMTTLATERQVRGWELLMQKFANSGSGTFTPSRSSSEPPRMTDAEWSRMSYGEQKDYAARASANSGGRR
jgi:hypothetical protein